MNSPSRSQPGCAPKSATSDAEPSAVECPFCEDGLTVLRIDGGIVTGVCERCRETVQVEATR